jgi:hypothetical protein
MPTPRMSPRRIVVTGLICLIAWCASATSAVGSSKGPAPLYWGAEIGAQITGEKAPWDMRAVRRFAKVAGKGLSLVSFTAPFAECSGSSCVFGKFPTTPLENVRRYGAIPVFGWNSGSDAPGVRQPEFGLADLVGGRYDAYIREFAIEAREWGHPFFLRFDWEMNGFWFPWAEGVNGNKPGEFVVAWRHVHDIFSSVGATNATWVWSPNIDLQGALTPLRSLYPGDRYVDWTGIDGFNWGKRRGSPGWRTFDQVFQGTYRRIVRGIAPGKPLMISEVASTARGGNKAAWIKDMLAKIPRRYPKVRGVVWYDLNDRGSGWPIETSPRASSAFRTGIGAAVYRPNLYGDVATSPIRPPSR